MSDDAPETRPASDDPPSLPTRIRFERRELPRQRTDISLIIFLALMALLTLMGWKGFQTIGEFLTVAQRAAKTSRPSPTPPSSPGEVMIQVEDRAPGK